MKKIIVAPLIILTLIAGAFNNVFAENNNNIAQVSESQNTDITKFKEILEKPESIFDFKISEAKYVIKSTDTDYLLISATSEELKGIHSVKVFAFDKEKNSIIELEKEFVIGESEGKFTGRLEEYSNNANKLRYTVKSITNDKFEIKNITFEKNEIEDEMVREGVITKDELPLADVRELSWKILDLKKGDNPQQTSSTESTVSKDKNKEANSEIIQKSTPKIEKKGEKKSKFDINAISNGDLSSLVGGVYSDTFIKDNKTIGIGYEGGELGVDLIKKEGNVAIIESSNKASLGEAIVVDRAPVYHYIVPAGEKSPVEVENDDISRDRIITQKHANKEVSFVG